MAAATSQHYSVVRAVLFHFMPISFSSVLTLSLILRTAEVAVVNDCSTRLPESGQISATWQVLVQSHSTSHALTDNM